MNKTDVVKILKEYGWEIIGSMSKSQAKRVMITKADDFAQRIIDLNDGKPVEKLK